MNKPPSINDILAGLQSGKGSTYVVDVKKGLFQTDGSEEDHRRAMEALAGAERLAKIQAQSVQNDAPRATQPSTPAPPSGFTLRQMIELWEVVDVSGLKSGTVASMLRKLNDFADHFGEKRPVADVRRTDVSAWDAANVKKGNVISTRIGKCSHVIQLFDCAIRKGHYLKELGNPAEDVVCFREGEKAQRAEDHGWEAFTLAQLKQLFGPQNLQQTEMPHTRRGLVVGLFTGARVGEVAQLKLTDFETINGVECVRFQGDLKTKTSKRLIPLHPDLLRLGIMEWVAEQKKRGQTRLFSTVDITKKNKGGAISKGTSNLLAYLDIKVEEGKKNRLGFHSFRSTVVQEIQNAPEDFSDERRRAYVGHAPYEKKDKSIHKTNYMREWKPKEIEGLHAGITWGQWLDFVALKTVLDETDPNPEFIAAKRNAARQIKSAERKAQAAKI